MGNNQRKTIVRNRIRCNLCGDIIESRYRHDFKSCRCGAVCVDGGKDYIRRGFLNSLDDYTDRSVYEDSNETSSVDS